MVLLTASSGGVGQIKFYGTLACGLVRRKQWVGLVVGSEQCFEALPQGGVAIAHSVQEGGALVGWLFQRERKQHFFTILSRWHGRLRLVHSSIHAYRADKKY